MQTRLPNGQIVYQEDYNCIIEPQNGKGGIFIGNLQAAQNLKTLRKHCIRAILSAAKGVDLNHPKTEIPFYLQVPGQDRDGFDMARFFGQGVNFIRDALQNTSIMVHCLAGVSRSVCLVLAFFIKCKGYSYEEAYNLVKIKRSIIHPNQGFIAQLKKYQRQVRQSSSPSRYQIVSSPTKKKYQYYQDSVRNNPESTYRYEPQSYISPTKRSIIEHYVPAYESPTKKDYRQNINQSYENSANKLYGSPIKKRIFQQQNKQSAPIYQPSRNFGLRRLTSYQQTNNLTDDIELRHISPERKRYIQDFDYKNRSNSIIDNKQTKLEQSKKLYGNYDRHRHTSTIELSEQLDNKIAAIRKKYAQYTQNQFTGSRKISGIQSEPRVNNFIDENQYGICGNLTIKKMNSEYQGINSKVSGRDYGTICNNYGRASGVGLGLRKLNSLRQGY